MTDSEKLDLLLEKMGSLEDEMKSLKRQQMKNTAELKATAGGLTVSALVVPGF